MHSGKERKNGPMALDLPTLSEEELIQKMENLLAGTFDTDAELQVQAIMDELDKRSKNAPEFDADTGWTALEEKHPLFFEDDCTFIISEKTPKHSRKKYFRISALAAALAALLAITGIAQAAGVNIFETIARWGNDIFYFERPNANLQASSGNRYNSLCGLVISDNIAERVAPTWFPDNMAIRELSSTKKQDGVEYYAVYGNDTASLSISISDRITPTSPPYYEKSDGVLEIYETGGIQHYIIQNNDTVTAAWTNQSFECSISTTLSVEVVKQIIDSIYQ